MASDQDFVDFIKDQLSDVTDISCRKLFGEYAIYVGKKLVALICNNTLYVKPTNSGRKFIGSPVEMPPYPGAKPSFQIQDSLEDRDWLSNLFKLTCDELPEPKAESQKKRVKNQFKVLK